MGFNSGFKGLILEDGTDILSRNFGNKLDLTDWPMTMGPIGYSETSVSTTNLRRVKSRKSGGLKGNDGYTSALCSKIKQ